MAELSGCIISPSVKAAVDNYSTSQARADTNIEQVADIGVLRLAVPDFRQRGTTRGVVDYDRQSRRLFQQLDHRNIAPGQDHRNQKFAAVAINQSRKANAYTCKLNKVVVLGTQLGDLLSDLGKKTARIVCSFETQSCDKTIVKVAQRQDCFVSTNVHTEQTETQSIKSQGRGRFATNWSRSSRALFDDATILEEFSGDS